MRWIFILCSLLWVQTLSAQQVYRTASGQKYHAHNCRYVKDKGIAITLQKAVEMGLTACSVCKPASATSNSSSSSQNMWKGSSNSTTTSTQCHGKTKAGARCKRTTSNKNGYCYQHQP